MSKFFEKLLVVKKSSCAHQISALVAEATGAIG